MKERNTKKIIKLAKGFIDKIPPEAVLELSISKSLLVVNVLPKWKWKTNGIHSKTKKNTKRNAR